MVEKESVEQIFISYLDDDETKKDQWVILVSKDSYCVNFRFKDSIDVISIPWARVFKIKEKGESNG